MFVREYVLSKMSKDLFMYAVQWGKKEEEKKEDKRVQQKIGQFVNKICYFK